MPHTLGNAHIGNSVTTGGLVTNYWMAGHKLLDASATRPIQRAYGVVHDRYSLKMIRENSVKPVAQSSILTRSRYCHAVSRWIPSKSF